MTLHPNPNPSLDEDPTASPKLRVEMSYPAPGTVVVRPVGEVDLSTSPLLRHALTDAELAGSRRVTVDLDRLAFFDATALDLLVAAGERVRAAGGSLLVRCHSRLGRRILEAGEVDFLLEHPAAADGSPGSCVDAVGD